MVSDGRFGLLHDGMAETARRFRVKPSPHRRHAAGKRRIRRRLGRPPRLARRRSSPPPISTYEFADEVRALDCGGIDAIRLLVRKLGVAEGIDERLHLLKYQLPYQEFESRPQLRLQCPV
jgi:hypothetical protein